MSKAPAKKRRPKAGADRVAERRSLERGVYGTILLIVAFILLIWFMLDPARETFWHAVVGAAVAVLGWINFVAIKAYRGARLADWQAPLAKLPLRFAGYGREGGKPLSAAKGQPNARNAIFASLGISVVLVLLLAFLLIPELR